MADVGPGSVLAQLFTAYGCILVVPGPNALVVLRSSLGRSVLAPVMTATGVASGVAACAAVAASSAAMLPHGDAWRTFSSVAVAVVLLRAALRLSFAPPDRNGPAEPARSRSSAEPFVVGFVTAMMNPLTVPFFAAFFVSHAWTRPMTALACCAVFGLAGTWFVSLGVAASRLQQTALPPDCRRVAKLTVAVALVSMAARYLWLAAVP